MEFHMLGAQKSGMNGIVLTVKQSYLLLFLISIYLWAQIGRIEKSFKQIN